MRRILSLVLILMLVLGSAYAETKDEIRARLGVCSAEDYEGVARQDWYAEEGELYHIEESVNAESGFCVWEVPCSKSKDDWYRYTGNYIQGQGIFAEVMADFDADGEDEWIAAVLRSEDESSDADSYMWISVYEMDGDQARLADETQIANVPMNFFCDGYKAFLIENDGKTLLTLVNVIFVDGRFMKIWQLRYDDERLWIDNGMFDECDECGRWITAVGEGDTENITTEFSYEMEIENETIASHDGDNEEFYKLLTDAAAERGLGYTLDEETWFMNFFALNESVTLYDIDCYAWDAQGKPVVRIQRNVPGSAVVATASVNLRTEPGLDGEIIAAAVAGTTMAYLGEESTDDRGVVWYKVMYEAQECWVSSKYAEIN